MLMPILAIVMTFSIIFTFTDFQLVYVITRGGPVNSTHLMATLAFQRGIPGGALGEGAAHRGRDDPVPAVGDAVQLLRPAAAQVAAGRSAMTEPQRRRAHRRRRRAWTYLRRSADRSTRAW